MTSSKKIVTLIIVLVIMLVSPLIVLINAEPSWVLWSQTYGGTENEGSFHSVYLVEANNGGYVLAASTTSFGAGEYDFWLVKTNLVGDIEWNGTVGGLERDSANSLIQTSDGGYAIAGNTLSYGAGKNDLWLVKTDSLGTSPIVSPTPTLSPTPTSTPESDSFSTTIAVASIAIIVVIAIGTAFYFKKMKKN